MNTFRRPASGATVYDVQSRTPKVSTTKKMQDTSYSMIKKLHALSPYIPGHIPRLKHVNQYKTIARKQYVKNGLIVQNYRFHLFPVTLSTDQLKRSNQHVFKPRTLIGQATVTENVTVI